jgi:cis-3-alkyl-4-acyloxetan-2-one decarboxylase
MATWQELYPFTSQYFELAPCKRLHFVQTGEANSHGLAILCVHGNPTWSFTYRRVLSEMSSAARVIAVDHLGCGLSDKPQRHNYCLEDHVSNLVRLIEHLDLRKVILLVHDWGGAIGLTAGLRVPDRIAGLAILNTAAFPPPYIPWRIAACRIPILGNLGMRGLNLFALAALRMTLHRLRRLDENVASGLIAPYSNWHDRIGIARFVQDIPSNSTDPTWKLLAETEQRLIQFRDRPARLIWGMQDWCFRPECLKRFQQILPQAKVTAMSDVGHYVMEEAADEVFAELRALVCHDAPSS